MIKFGMKMCKIQGDSNWWAIAERCHVHKLINTHDVLIEKKLNSTKKLPEERKKVNFWEEAHRRPHTIINFPSSQNCHSLRAFSQFWELGRIEGG